MTTLGNQLSVIMLGALVWIMRILLPKAWREHDVFGMTCSLLAALVAIAGCWLFADQVS